jgi:hypothetical protein
MGGALRNKQGALIFLVTTERALRGAALVGVFRPIFGEYFWALGKPIAGVPLPPVWLLTCRWSNLHPSAKHKEQGIVCLRVQDCLSESVHLVCQCR